ncbi:MAG: STAS domain-containing protein [Acidimicrobiales bacterium]
MTVIAFQPSTATHPATTPRDGTVATVTPIRPATGTPAAVYLAPVRFDVHALPAFEAWAADRLGAGLDLEIDLGEVEFIDLHMVESVRALAARAAATRRSATTSNVSPAARLTFELLERVA